MRVQRVIETCVNCGAENYNEMDADVCLTCRKCGSSIDVTYHEIEPPTTNTPITENEEPPSQEGE